MNKKQLLFVAKKLLKMRGGMKEAAAHEIKEKMDKHILALRAKHILALTYKNKYDEWKEKGDTGV